MTFILLGILFIFFGLEMQKKGPRLRILDLEYTSHLISGLSPQCKLAIGISGNNREYI